ncbi:VpsR-related response regulator, partial [Burkholderia gladioli]|nr:VpsR-related response regulator [Burkholderia gladioli]
MLDSDTSLSAGPFIAPPPIVPAESVTRPLVYLSRTPDAALVAHLRARGWQVQVCRSAQDTVRRPGQDATSAGIVDLDAFAPRELAALERGLRQPRIGWIALTGEARLDEPAVRQLIRQYCFDYVRHPAPPATLDYLVGHAYGMTALGESEPPTAAAAGGDEQMVGSCEAMQQLFRTIRKVASTNAPVFIAGESGTGKELTAVAIHERSARAEAPFVAINCGAIPHHLLQSELFG